MYIKFVVHNAQLFLHTVYTTKMFNKCFYFTRYSKPVICQQNRSRGSLTATCRT